MITNGIDALQPAVAVLVSENGDLDNQVDQVNQLSSVANRVAGQSEAGTVDTIEQLGPVLAQSHRCRSSWARRWPISTTSRG